MLTEPNRALHLQDISEQHIHSLLLPLRLRKQGWVKLDESLKSHPCIVFWIPLTFDSVSLLVVGLLSHFEKGESTRAQHGWIMSWLVCGMIWGSSALACSRVHIYLHRRIDWLNTCDISRAIIVTLVILVPLRLLVAPAVGGFVVVGQMISHSGTCTQIR